MDELSQYERDRNAKIARNQAFLASMGLGAAPAVPESTSAASRRPAPAPVPVPEASVAVTALRQTWPARAREAAALVAALAAPGDAPIIVSGPCAVGKTGLVSAAAAALGITCAWVNCGDAAVSAPRSWLVDRTCAGLDMVGSVCTGSGAAGARRAGPGTLTRRLAAAATASLRGRVVVVLDDCDRLLVRARRGATSSDNGAAAVRHLLVACRLAAGTARVVLLGDDRNLAPHAVRLRDPIRITFAPYAAPSALAAVLEAAGTRVRACVPGDDDAGAYSRFVRAVAAVARRDAVDAGHVQLLTNSRALFALYGCNGATAGYTRILPVLRRALKHSRVSIVLYEASKRVALQAAASRS
mmetsp:Transcript_32699/g.98367  ORF Transcript_32699/g.98367 Transcript_32699/m.98367 type:complete len:357 (+) Transcript_32699:48-1118(+)